MLRHNVERYRALAVSNALEPIMILHVLKTGGVLLLIVLAGWIGLTLFGPFGERRVAPRVLPVGSAFEGNVQLPREEIDRQFTAAANRMNTKYERSETYRTWSEIIDWVSFLCTALITLLAGYFGIQSQSGGSQPDGPRASLHAGTSAMVTTSDAANFRNGA